MLRSDTQCLCYKSGEYTVFLWDLIDNNAERRLADISWCFRILTFLGAPSGFEVTWWAVPVPRIIKPEQFPTRAEVNGGWAYRGAPAVYIFREEEWDRVLIHECVHAFNWDVRPSGHVKHCLEEALDGGQLTDAIFEAATELNAEWLWSIIHSPDNDTSGITWQRQMTWQLNQALAILARHGQKPWGEDTSVFAYYVLKAALAFEMEQFLTRWLAQDINVEDWCVYWKKYEKIFFHKAGMRKSTVNDTLSMRMTDPSLDSRSVSK